MKKTNKHLLAAGGIFCAVGILFFGVGVASGGKNYVKTADLNRISGAAMMDSGDSHAILSKTEIHSFSSVNVDLKNLDLDIKASDDDRFYISYNIETTDGMLPLSYQVQNGDMTISDSTFNNLELSADLGELKIKDTTFTNSQFEMMDGDVKAENVTFNEKNEFTSDLGDITLSIPKKTLSTLSIEAEASEINIPEKLGQVMTDEDDNQLVNSENKTQNSLQLESKDGDIQITTEK